MDIENKKNEKIESTSTSIDTIKKIIDEYLNKTSIDKNSNGTHLLIYIALAGLFNRRKI